LTGVESAHVYPHRSLLLHRVFHQKPDLFSSATAAKTSSANIWGIIKNRRSHLYRINGVEDHLNILTSLHPTVSLADFVKEVKTGSVL
jgi:putative transposase